MNETTTTEPTNALTIAERTFELAQRKAKALAASTLVPPQYQQNVGNCMIALEIAERLRLGALEVAQNLHVIHNRPAFGASFLIGLINRDPQFGRLNFDTFGEPGSDAYGMRAWAIEQATGERLDGTLVTIKMAKSEGWYNRSGSKWQTMPEQMLRYRAAAFWQRTYAPELTLGLATAEELVDSAPPPAMPGGPDWTAPPARPAKPAAPVEDGELVPAAPAETPAAAAPPETPPDESPGEADAELTEAVKMPYLTADGEWLDIDGVRYDPAKHGWNRRANEPSVTPAGRFRAKRQVAGKAAKASAPATPAPKAAAPGADAPAAADSAEPSAAGDEPGAASYSNTLRMLLTHISSAVDATALNRLEHHPFAAELDADERAVLVNACRERGEALAEL